MRRTILGFSQDDEDDWVARLSCLHGQHVRHRPPFQDREWVQSEAGRAGRIGSPIECPLCDRTELPDGLRRVRTAGPFETHTLPAGLRRAHRVGEGTWGVLRVLEGSLTLSMAVDPPLLRRLGAGDAQPLPPGVRHSLSVEGPVRLVVNFLVPDHGQTADGA